MKNIIMKEFVINLWHEIDIEIQTTESSFPDTLTRIKQVINCLDKSLRRLKAFTCSYEFQSGEEEIRFFKELKPRLYGQLLYFVRLHELEEHRPLSDQASESLYLSNEMKRLGQNFTHSLDFYRYYRSGDTSLDGKYFIRKEYDWALDKDPLSFEKDPLFSTSYDYEVANIIANDLLKVHLASELKRVSNEVCNNMIALLSEKQLQWTDSKVSLVELVYGIYSSGSINHGAVELKDLAICFETVFNVRVGDFYRAFLEIRERKRSRTQYIDQMKDTLIRRMDDLER